MKNLQINEINIEEILEKESLPISINNEVVVLPYKDYLNLLKIIEPKKAKEIETIFQNKVVLDFEIESVTGFEFGKEVFENQVKNKIDYTKSFLLIFPQKVKNLSSSFIQGFFDEMIHKIGFTEIEKNLNVTSSNLNLKIEIIKNLY